jgi:nitroreductase
MEFFEVIKARRSIRKYLPELVPDEVVDQALDAALLAPNSSNMQTWEFYWVKNPEKKKKLAEACLSQNAARSAQHLVVIVADPSHWRRNQQEMLKHLSSSPPIVRKYYEKLIPFTYGMHFLAPIKWLMMNAVGLFRPMSRRPWSFSGVQDVAVKSASLAAENFMLAVTAQGYDTCPMEGFDECRVKKICGLGWKATVVMVISVGKRDPKGVWGSQLRFPRDWFVKQI